MTDSDERGDCGADIPQHVIDSLAKVFLPLMLDSFGSEEGQHEYAKWKAAYNGDKDISL